MRETHTPNSNEALFADLMRRNVWSGTESISGTGSTLEQTTRIREALPALLRRRSIRTMLDLPCGDCHWIRHVDLPIDRYIGADVVGELIEKNRRSWGESPARVFRRLDIMRDDLPVVDLILCRDGLVHFSDADVSRATERIIASGSTYLLTTVFTDSTYNRMIDTGDWRRLNLMVPPFDWPEPLELIVEGCTEDDGRYADKSLALWRVSDLPLVTPV